MVIPRLRGCDTYWVSEREQLIDNLLQPKIDKAVVGQVWPFGGFFRTEFARGESVVNEPTEERPATIEQVWLAVAEPGSRIISLSATELLQFTDQQTGVKSLKLHPSESA